jgi:hypothetical protein
MARFISIEALIPATGDPLADHDIMDAIKEPLASLKAVIHALKPPGNVVVRHVGKKEPKEAKVVKIAAE